MTPEKTNFITQGYDGLRKLKAGPMLDSYRGLSIIHSRQYSLETGAPPRDLLRRRVRVAEYYRIPWQDSIESGKGVMFDLYDESKDTFFTISWQDLLEHAALDEADRVKFSNMGEQPDLQNSTSTTIMFDTAEEKDMVSIMRAVEIPARGVVQALQIIPGPTSNPSVSTHLANQYNNVEGNERGGLVLITNNISSRTSGGRLKVPTNQRRLEELKSFYTGSGWFNASGSTPNNQRPNNIGYNLEHAVYMTTMVANPFGVNVNVNLPNVQFPNTDDRNFIFKTLMFGRFTGVQGAQGGQNGVQHDPYVNFGMRPNLHIGKMVYADVRPDTMRFKHVAANIIAQTVVTRPLAIRLMQQVEKTPDENLINEIKYLFGIDMFSRQVCFDNVPATNDIPEECSFFGLESCALAYMAAGVMHPNPEVRRKCRDKLRENLDYDLEEIGESLVTWIKCFLNAIPLPAHGAESPAFDAYEQGRVLQTTFELKGPTPGQTEDGVNIEAERMKLPVMYLGEYIKREKADRIFQDKHDIQQGIGPAVLNNVVRTMQHPKWSDMDPNNMAMDRDVDANSFTHRRAFVFPDGREKIEPQDVIAVTRTATGQDTLIAFIQIMCKRFFTCRQELYVETSNPAGQVNGRNREKNKERVDAIEPNPEFEDMIVTRRALTSNEYPVIFVGPKDMLKTSEKWEIVVVRPNIEHNMLAAVLGRGGIEELGSTFWGQTELSCYDDSMHGIWGMSYKYHERAMVTNEKNLIRLWDVAYDGYNGGKDDTVVSWTAESGHRSWRTFKAESANTTMPYTGPSIMVCVWFLLSSLLQQYTDCKITVSICLCRSWHSPSTLVTRLGRGTGRLQLCSTSRILASLLCR